MNRVLALAIVLLTCTWSGAFADEAPFQVQTHGFGFRNYGNDEGITNLTPAEMLRLFGPGVNACPDSSELTLVPAAEEFMQQLNHSIGGGHCEGLAVLSELFHLGQLKPSDFGAEKANDLKLEENTKLQREIALWWATQCTDTTRAAVLKQSPAETVETLRKALAHNDVEKGYVLEFFMPDHTAGHAVTPYAIVDTDDTHSHIMVYDNNFPNQERFFEVDRAANTWSYSTAANPAEPSNSYTGDASTLTLQLTPSAVRLKVQECAFLGLPPFSEDQGLENPSEDKAKPGDEAPDDPDDEMAEDASPAGHLVPDDGEPVGHGASPSPAPPAHHHNHDQMASTPSEKKYSTGAYQMEIALTGLGADLMIKDPKGHRTGVDHGKALNEIPGAEVLWMTNFKAPPAERESPRFRVPGGVDYLISITGTSDTTKPVHVSCLSRGSELVVQDISLEKGKTDTVFFSPDGTRVAYRPSGEEHPTLVAGYEAKGPDFEITVHGVETTPGAMVELEIIPKTGCAKVQVLDSKAPATVEVEIERMAHDGVARYENDDLKLEPNDAAYFHFAAWKGGKTPMSVDFDRGGDGKIDSVVQFPNESKK